MKLDVSKLKRNPNAIKQCLKRVGKSTVATQDINIMFPVRFVKRDMANIEQNVTVVAYYAILDTKGNYAITRATMAQVLTPSTIDSNVEVDGSLYYMLSFKKGETVIPTDDVIEDAYMLYNILDEFFIKGNVPWYFTYTDLVDVIANSKEYAGSDIGSNTLALEVLGSIVARSPKNRSVAFKDFVKNQQEADTIRPKFIGLGDVYDAIDDTGSRLLGAYFDKGLTKALVTPETKSGDAVKSLRE